MRMFAEERTGVMPGIIGRTKTSEDATAGWGGRNVERIVDGT
jgi:hypothetical protein